MKPIFPVLLLAFAPSTVVQSNNADGATRTMSKRRSRHADTVGVEWRKGPHKDRKME